MQRRYQQLGVLAAILAAILGIVSCGHRTPSGQAPLENLTPRNVAQLENAFNASKGEVRLILLLSPT